MKSPGGKAYSKSIHIVGFSTGGLLALYQAAIHPQLKVKSVISVNAPVRFRNKNMVFIPLVHHANRLVSWVNDEGLMPFTPNLPENPAINYQHIPIRALYQLQQFIDQIIDKGLKIAADVYLFQGDRDPVVDSSSIGALQKAVAANSLLVNMLDADQHGVIYRDIDDVQRKICECIAESV